MSAIDFLNQKLGGESTQKVGIGGFTALARVRHNYELTSEIPTTHLEDGSSVEDHIILNPVRLNIEGEVADVYIAPAAIEQVAQRAASTAGLITVYGPPWTASQAQKAASLAASITDQIRAADRLLDAGEQALSIFGNKAPGGAGLRAKFVDAMEALHIGKQLVSIDMPFRTFDNMRITSVWFGEDNERKVLGFRITAQQMRFADQATSDISTLLGNPSDALGGQAQGEVDKGVQEGKEAATSLLGTILGF